MSAALVCQLHHFKKTKEFQGGLELDDDLFRDLEPLKYLAGIVWCSPTLI
jgi:hypothetical protein